MNGMFWVLMINLTGHSVSGPIPYIFETEEACTARGQQVTGSTHYQLSAALIKSSLGYSCEHMHVQADNKDGRSAKLGFGP